MNGSARTVLLQSQNAEAVRVIFDQNGSHDIRHQILDEDSILGQFFKTVVRYADVTGEHERLNAAKRFCHDLLRSSLRSLARPALPALATAFPCQYRPQKLPRIAPWRLD